MPASIFFAFARALAHISKHFDIDASGPQSELMAYGPHLPLYFAQKVLNNGVAYVVDFHFALFGMIKACGITCLVVSHTHTHEGNDGAHGFDAEIHGSAKSTELAFSGAAHDGLFDRVVDIEFCQVVFHAAEAVVVRKNFGYSVYDGQPG